jgi:hypothetical protein
MGTVSQWFDDHHFSRPPIELKIQLNEDDITMANGVIFLT